MSFLRKLLAIIVMILAILGALLCIGGVIGAWVYNEPITQAVTSALSSVDRLATAAGQAAGIAVSATGEVEARLRDLEQRLPLISEDTRADINSRVEQLMQPVTQLNAAAGSLSQSALALNDLLTAASRFPGSPIDAPTGQLVTVGEKLGQVNTALTSLESAIAEGPFDGTRISGLVSQTANDIADLNSRIAQTQADLAQAQASIAALNAAVPGLINLASLGITLLLTLFGAGQISLFAHALEWFKGKS